MPKGKGKKEEELGLWERKERTQMNQTIYTLARPFALQKGLFSGFSGTFDFLYKGERDKIADLLESLEFLATQNILDALENSEAYRKMHGVTSFGGV